MNNYNQDANRGGGANSSMLNSSGNMNFQERKNKHELFHIAAKQLASSGTKPNNE